MRNHILTVFLTIFQLIIVDSNSNILQQINDEQMKSLVIVIISQANPHHHDKALKLQQDLYIQSDQIAKVRPVVHISHIDFPHVGGWTFIPLIPELTALHASNSSGIFFLQDSTYLDLLHLFEMISKYSNQERFVGYALYDNEPSIIHHFAFYDNPKRFKYPNQASGFLITTSLLLNLSQRIADQVPKTDFNIDAAHELALFIWADGNGTELTHESSFCTELPKRNITDKCTSYPQPFVPCGEAVQKDEIYFSVKTCRKFHRDRLRVVQSTWAKHAGLIKYFSDYEDSFIPTINLGIPNTEHGHCEKTFSILRYVLQDINHLQVNKHINIKWIVLVDDDTILSVSHIKRLLSCYDPDENVVLGERYGYGVRSKKGYNYVTGGGGTVISRNLLPLLVDHCECPSANAPDDMYLGFCLRELATDIVHSPLFHQARPNDYANDYLKSYQNNTVSFHKHWMIDPVKVYKTWFEQADNLLVDSTSGHEEL